jgi:N-acetylglutamate synthase-like GNAT family acetyltransferase
MDEIKIRRAERHEAVALTALMRRAKAHWGYDPEFMRLSEASFAIPDELFARGHVLVAASEAGPVLGVASLEPLPNEGDFDLLHMFVEPVAIGRGAGRALFEAIAEVARDAGARRLVILSDPNATAFYERMGARRTGDAPSDAIPGRHLPLLELSLDQRSDSSS